MELEREFLHHMIEIIIKINQNRANSSKSPITAVQNGENYSTVTIILILIATFHAISTCSNIVCLKIQLSFEALNKLSTTFCIWAYNDIK